MLRRSALALCSLLALSASTAFAESPVGEKVEYNRDIRPILSDNCFACHGPDKNHRKAKLRLDIREEALKKEAFVPGKPDESEMIKRIFSNDPDEIMPTPNSHKTLTPAQKELFKKWIAQGAEYQPHWAYITPTRPAVPTVKGSGWTRNAIDAFILKELEARKIEPSKEADRRTLLRRLSLDLIGLPPTPEEMQAFLDDKSPDAYEKQVDRLIASPHFGERMAAPWLDYVRYADTVGYHGDQNQNVFPYRDYVINAFNSNKPFDQFTIEQLAGDLLPNPTNEQLVATGFNRLNMVTREGGAQPKEYLAKYTADRVRTVANTWLGSTFACAECHDHKFDPISTKDFYSLGAYFADIRQWGVYSDYSYTPNPDLKGWSNDHPFPPEIRVDSPYLAAREARLEKQLADAVAKLNGKLEQDDKARAAMAAWSTKTAEFLKKNPTGWEIPALAGPSTKPATQPAKTPALPEGFVLPNSKQVGKTVPPTDIVLKPTPGWVAAVRLEAAGDLSAKPLNNGSQRAGLKLSVSVKPAKGAVRKAGVYHADAQFKEPRYSGTEELIGIKDGWKIPAGHAKEKQASYWLLDPPLQINPGDTLTVSVSGDTFIPVRVSVSPLAWSDPLQIASPAMLAAIQSDAAKRSPEQKSLIEQAYLFGTAWDAEGFSAYKTLQRQILECRNGKAWQQVVVSQKPTTARILPRGNWQDESGEIVTPNPPHFLPGATPAGSEAKPQNRLDLAKWIVSPQNPLTSRVFVNRVWKQFFGTGICNSVEDVGAQGEPPSHPELLDWLAVEFQTPTGAEKPAHSHGWDVKHVVRLIVTSSTYRQDSNLRKELKEIDGANRLLASQNPRRLDAEFVRDNALTAAGLIVLDDIGGPSVKPYQPGDYYANLQFPSRVYTASADERQYRRGVYTHWQRTFLHPMLANFDAPSREDSVCTRTMSNTPQQALTLLNDPEFVEAARVLAQRTMGLKLGGDAERINFVYERTLCRPVKEAEKESLLNFLATQRKYYGDNPQDAKKLIHIGNSPTPEGWSEPELAAWTTVCRVVLNLHESITRY